MNFADYIGIQWEAGAQGPDAYDCMGFFRVVQREHFGIEVPTIISPDYDDGKTLATLFSRHEERSNWVRIEKPEHGCAVIIRGPLHIGTWLNIDGGGVIHSARGAGVIFTADGAWPTSGFGAKEFYKHV
jgi:hypothetical protein